VFTFVGAKKPAKVEESDLAQAGAPVVGGAASATAE